MAAVQRAGVPDADPRGGAGHQAVCRDQAALPARHAQRGPGGHRLAAHPALQVRYLNVKCGVDAEMRKNYIINSTFYHYTQLSGHHGMERKFPNLL